MSITFLIAEARALAGDRTCAAGHNWESIGGRKCPRFKDQDNCSQTVFVCTRCGETDFGDVGGPAHVECYQECDQAWRFEDGPLRYLDGVVKS